MGLRRWITALSVLTLMLVGCSQINVFDAAVACASSTVAIVTASSDATPAQREAILAWDSTVVLAIGQAVSDVSAGGTVSQVAVKVTGDLAGISAAEPSLTGMPSAIANVVQAEMGAINAILKAYQPPPVAVGTKMATLSKVSPADQERLAKVRYRSLVVWSDCQRSGVK